MEEFTNVKWNPIRVENGQYVGNLPSIDDNNGNDEFLITIDTGNHRYTNTDIWNDNHNRFENFNVIGEIPYGIFAGDGIVAWANFPEHYKGE
jgi:hypothetical protein